MEIFFIQPDDSQLHAIESIFPIIGPGKFYASFVQGQVALGQGTLDLLDELIDSGCEVQQVFVNAHLRQRRGNHRLACTDVLVELHRIDRVRHVVEPERNQAGIEMIQVKRHLRVRLPAQQLDIGLVLKTRQIVDKNIPHQNEVPLWPPVRQRRQQGIIEPLRQGTVVTNDRPGKPAQHIIGKAVLPKKAKSTAFRTSTQRGLWAHHLW